MKELHFIGIGGIGMSGLARIALEKGIKVTGSDRFANKQVIELQKLGAKIYEGHAASHVPPEAAVVYTSAVNALNPELEEAKRLNSPLFHRSDLLAELIEGHTSIAVAGTHGKTSCSSLLTWVLYHAKRDPSFSVGGVIASLNSNGHKGEGPLFVIEADESDGSFLKYNSDAAIVTNIDSDHMDHYGSDLALNQAFQQFLTAINNPETLFYCGDDTRLKSLQPKGISYGFEKGNDLFIHEWIQKDWIASMTLEFQGKVYSNVPVPLPGKHQALNAAAVFGMALHYGLEEKEICEGLNSFPGVARRTELLCDSDGILVIDDYAHHPKEIETTLEGIRAATIGRRLCAVFQPHRYSRTQNCLGSFSGVFDSADHVVITDVFAAGESPIQGADAYAVMQDIHKSCEFLERQNLAKSIREHAQEGDVIVMMGAGDITTVAKELSALLQPACR